MNKYFETINLPHKISIEISPNEADIAIVSTDDTGGRSQLNSFVLNEYGYTTKDLPGEEELKTGFTLITGGRKPIIFIVTVVEGRSTRESLKKNLYSFLFQRSEYIKGKTLWIPLMGTGTGELTLEESYDITVKTINEFQRSKPTETTILLSIPDSSEGNRLYQNITSQDSSNPVNENEDAKSFIKKYGLKFYAVGAFWSGGDQTNRFIKDKIWENRYRDGKYSKLINSVKVNDILILKSAYAKDGSYLRVKAWGIVTENKRDGVTLKVDWKITGLNEDIENLGSHRHTFYSVSPKNAAIILSSLDKNHWGKLLPPEKELIAKLMCDSDKGEDCLEITKDVNAFAKVISAQSFEPPLAIALFGKWGSGKSFFMRKLKERIEMLSTYRKEIYCEGIAHIHFNAWSYMDSNLWASLVTKIFEGLNNYISDNTEGDKEKKEIEKELTKRLTIAQEESKILEKKRDFVEKQIASCEQERENINRRLEEKITKLKTDTIWNSIEEVVKNASKNIHEILNKNKDLEGIIPEEYRSNPEKVYQLVTSKVTFIREFFRRDKILINLIWFIPVLLIMLFFPLILELLPIQISKINFIIPEIVISLLTMGVASWRRGKAVYKQLQPAISSFWKIKEGYDKEIQKTVAQFEQEEKVLRMEIEKDKSEILLISEQIQKAESIKTDLQFRIDNALTTEALYSFIDKRSKSEDYQKHLGIISTIRKDFETLSCLFTGHIQEVDNMNNKAEFVELVKKLKKPLKRIILYIDDLDRCPEENVVQVLEAVNLLMAFPLFVVVVGVDARWVKNALLKRHALQFSGKLNGNDTSSSGIEIIEASNYLEKIFQVPFHLKEASDESVRGMIENLAKTDDDAKKTGVDSKKQADDDAKKTDEDFKEQIGDDVKKETNEDSKKQTDDDAKKKVDIIAELILNENEIKLMQDMSQVLGNNPRAIKRFVNIFRIIKAHGELSYSSDAENKELTAILFLLALPLGEYKKLLPSLEKFIYNKDNNEEPLSKYLQDTHKVDKLDDLKHKLSNTLNKSNLSILKNIQINDTLREHNSFIRRFTFKQL